MKECDYCGRENEDDAVYCRECGTEEFKNDPPKVRTRFTVVEFINNCATSLDELASSREMLLSWVMAAWIALAIMHLFRMDYAQSVSYVGSKGISGWENFAVPLLLGPAFVIAPLIGVWSLARWLHQEKKQVILNLMAWMMIAIFVAVFCIVWLVLWNGDSTRWFGLATEY